MCQASGFWRGRDPTCEGVMHINNYYTSTSLSIVLSYTSIVCIHGVWLIMINLSIYLSSQFLATFSLSPKHFNNLVQLF